MRKALTERYWYEREKKKENWELGTWEKNLIGFGYLYKTCSSHITKNFTK